MKPSDVRIGQLVVCHADSEDVGTVESFDAADNIVYVQWPIPGHPGKTDLLDMDPADLEPAA